MDWTTHMSRHGDSKLQAGFSMIELMVALGMTLMIAAAALMLVSGSLKITSATYGLTDAEQTLRSVQEILNRDLTNAGEGLQGIGKVTTPVGFAQNYLTRTPVLNGLDTAHADIGLVTSDDNIPANIAVPQASPAVNFLAGSDRITMLVQDTSFPVVSVLAGKVTQVGANTLVIVASTDIGKFQVGEIYAIVSNDATLGVVSAINATTFTLTLSAGDVFSLNQTGTASPIYSVGVLNGSLVSTQAVAIVRFQAIQFYVDSTKLLHRRVFGVKGASFLDSIVG